MISVEQLRTLCEQRTVAPLGLESYRPLFTCHGEVDTQPPADDADDWLRTVQLAATICELIRDRSWFGPLSASHLSLVLGDSDPDGTRVTEKELEPILATLASPLLGVLVGDPSGGYRVTAPPAIVAARLRILTTTLGPHAATTTILPEPAE